jgi:hypothetical protein
MTTHTHTGLRSHVGYRPCGWRLHGHHLPKPGERHALKGGPAMFHALCGKWVELVRHDEFGEPARPNVRACGDPEALPVTCKRCLRLIREASKPQPEEQVDERSTAV